MKVNLKKCFFFLYAFLANVIFMVGFSQSQTIFNKINQSNGLSNDRVSSIVKEKNGFVWIGTQNGLNRYDGNKIKIYNKQNSALSSNNISALLMDHKGRVWIATFGGGLNLYNPSENKFTIYKNISNKETSLASNELNTIYEDSKGGIWLGTKNGLSFFEENKNSFKNYKFQNNNNKSISNNDVRCIYEDENKNFWIGTFGGGLNKFIRNTGEFERIMAPNKISPNYIHSICRLNKNEILIGTSGNGLVTFEITNSNFSKKKYGIDKNISIVRCLKKDKKGSIWIGTDGNGAFKIENINTPKIKAYNYTNEPKLEPSISSNAIYDLIEDEDSNIWLGTAWNGVNVISFNKNFDFLPSLVAGETPTSVLSIYKNANAFFIGLDGKGLTILYPKTNTIQRFNKERKNAIGDDYIQYINEAHNGTLWIGTFVNGLVNFNPRTQSFTQFKQQLANKKSLSYNDVRYVIEDDKKNLWVATWGGGLNYFNTSTKEFKSYKKKIGDKFSISSDNVITLQKDKNSIWIATFGGGINIFDIKKNRFKAYKYLENNPNTISSNYVYSLLKDSKGNLWIGTVGDGINLYDRKTKKFNRFDNYKSIRYQTVTAIIEDNMGLIWFSTKEGIFNYNYTTKNFKNFSDLKGDYHINSCFKDEKGILYFGSSKGIIKFNPETIKNRNITPRVKLTNFKLFNKEVAIGKDEILKKNIAYVKDITLKHDSEVITFEFAAMQFPSSANCEYQIKLENFDNNWRSIGKDGTVTYTNLSPGKYIFKVKSRESGSEWTEDYSAVNLKILKPFWLEWWALLFYIALIILIFYIFRKNIISWQKMEADLRLEKFSHEKDIELYDLKQDFFTNISHEIRTPVTLILSSINKLLKNRKQLGDDEQLQHSTNTIKKNGEYLLTLINELLNFEKLDHRQIKLNITKNDWVKFSKEIYLSFIEIAQQKNIEFTFESSSPAIELWFDKNQMEKVLYNLLSNALKFTDIGGFIQLSIIESDDTVVLKLKDKGIGISKKQLSKIFNRFYQSNEYHPINDIGFGLGLTISKEIIKLHCGEIFVKSKKDFGSTFIINLKKGRAHFDNEQTIGDINSDESIGNYFDNEQNENEITKQTAVSDHLKQQTLLLIEDNSDIRKYIVELLSNEFTILQAMNGKEGLKIATEKLPDLIVSDIMMPVMDGIELTRNLKTNIHTSHIPIILLTAKASFAHKIKGFEIGADDYITKPFNELLLRTRIKNILKNRILLHERFRSENMSLGELTKNKSDLEFLQNLEKLIEENIDSNDFSANFIVKYLGMSHSVIYKKLKILTGMSLIEYIRDYKLKKAKQLLEAKQYSITQVCYQIGYSDRKYFSKLFKERFGNPPSFYLKEK